MDFPVFGRSARAHGAQPYRRGWNSIPVTIGEVTVLPGDYVLADASAVVFLAQIDAEKTLDAAETIAGREAAMAKALHDGKPITQLMSAEYDTC